MARRIAKLTVEEGKFVFRGTAFVIGSRHLLTAFHVVGDRINRVRYTGTIQVEFPTAPLGAPLAASFVDADAAADWALLALDTDVADLQPWPLRRSYRVTDPWRSFGYPDGAGPGDPFLGTITGVDPHIVLFCQEARQGARVPGLSGAPCLVDGHAVGIILSATSPELCGYQDGRMYVCSIATIAAACDAVKALVPETPPFTPQVRAELAPPGVAQLLPMSAQRAHLPEDIETGRLAPLVAEQILRREPLDAVALLEPLTPQLAPAGADEILYFTSLARLGAEETAALATAVRSPSPNTIIGLNAGTSAFGERFVHRAGYPDADHPGWKVGLRTLDVTHGERGNQQFLDDCADRLGGLLGCDPAEVDAEYAAHDHGAEPLILVVPPHLPAAASVSALHQRFPRVRLVLLCGAGGVDALAARFPSAVIVRPPLATGTEDASEDQYRRSLKKMKARYQALGRRT